MSRFSFHSRRTALVVPVLVLALSALGGCAQPVGKCSAGVGDLSTLSSVTVQNPC